MANKTTLIEIKKLIRSFYPVNKSFQQSTKMEALKI